MAQMSQMTHLGFSVWERIQDWCGESWLIFTIHESEASRASNCMGSSGLLQGLWRGPGAEPRQGFQGAAPPEAFEF